MLIASSSTNDRCKFLRLALVFVLFLNFLKITLSKIRFVIKIVSGYQKRMVISKQIFKIKTSGFENGNCSVMRVWLRSYPKVQQQRNPKLPKIEPTKSNAAKRRFGKAFLSLVALRIGVIPPMPSKRINKYPRVIKFESLFVQ